MGNLNTFCETFALGVREKHPEWEALLEKALAEECSAPAILLEMVRRGVLSSCPASNSRHSKKGREHRTKMLSKLF